MRLLQLGEFRLAGDGQLGERLAIGDFGGIDVRQQPLVEEAAAAAESLQDQAGKLSQAVGVFKLDGMVSSAWTEPAVVSNVVTALPRAKLKVAPAPAARPKRLAAASGHR